MSRAIFDERLFQDLVRGHLPNRCTIETQASGLDDAGQPSGAWSAVTGQVGIPCADWAARATEIRTDQLTAARVSRIALLAGEFTISKNDRAVIGSRTYNVLGAETTSHGRLTRLELELVTT